MDDDSGDDEGVEGAFAAKDELLYVLKSNGERSRSL